MNKVEPGGGGASRGMNPSLFCCLPVSRPPQSFLGVPPPSLPPFCGGQMMKHRLQRLLRPQKEERRSRPQPSSVATVGLEEMKSKVRSNLLRHHLGRNLFGLLHLLNLFFIWFHAIIHTRVVTAGLSVNKRLFKWSHKQQAWYDLSDHGSNLRVGNLINTPDLCPVRCCVPARVIWLQKVDESALYAQPLKEFN